MNGSYAYLDSIGPHITFPADESSAALFYLDVNKQLHSTAAGPKDYAGTYDLGISSDDGYGILFASTSFGLTPIACQTAARLDGSCRLKCVPGFATSDNKLYQCPYTKGEHCAYFHSERASKCSPLTFLVEAAS